MNGEGGEENVLFFWVITTFIAEKRYAKRRNMTLLAGELPDVTLPWWDMILRAKVTITLALQKSHSIMYDK